MTDYLTKITFNSYKLPGVQSENGSNLTSNKDTIIEGVRADGAIVIPGGRKSQRITITGVILGSDYKTITDLMNTMKSSITTATATLTMQHKESSWVNDWSYTIKRIGEIEFPPNMRTSYQEYSIEFLVLSYT